MPLEEEYIGIGTHQNDQQKGHPIYMEGVLIAGLIVILVIRAIVVAKRAVSQGRTRAADGAGGGPYPVTDTPPAGKDYSPPGAESGHNTGSENTDGGATAGGDGGSSAGAGSSGGGDGGGGGGGD